MKERGQLVDKLKITIDDANRQLDERGALYLTIMEEANQYTSSVPFYEGENSNRILRKDLQDKWFKNYCELNSGRWPN